MPDAKKYEEEDLVDHCWEVIDKQADEAVKSAGFVTIERSLLEELVERDSLNVKEVELFKAVDCWATKECEKQGLAADGSVKRRILGERIVKGIRFPVMEEKEFAEVVLDSSILTPRESFDVVKYFNSVLKLPLGFSEAKRTGSYQRMSRFRLGNQMKGWGYSQQGCDSLTVLLDKNIKLYAVRLFGSEDNEYLVTLKVSYLNGAVLATKTDKFLSQLVQSEGAGLDYYGFDIRFEPPIALERNVKYCFDAFISGPPSWYGQYGQNCVEHAGVKFSFMQNPGSRTMVASGQFSEFEFTVN